ncbi:MAG: phosphonate ABC transporter ATP-binding protein [Phormidesmis sp.]
MAKSATDAAAEALALENVTCRFGSVVALDCVSLAIAPGERVALVGPSGAGKSTLLKLFNGSISPSSGQVSVLGQSLYRLSGRRRRQLQRQIGMVYQQHQLVSNLSVIHNVNAGHLGRWPLWKALWSLVWPQQVDVARQVLEQLGLADKLHARTERLSGGQQQRVALARVMVQNPKVVLADEPVASVDPARADDMMQQLCALTQRRRTLLVSLHTVRLAKAYCDRIVGLRRGHIVFDVPAASIDDQQLTELYNLCETTA